jgi:hypothetical protein
MPYWKQKDGKIAELNALAFSVVILAGTPNRVNDSILQKCEKSQALGD